MTLVAKAQPKLEECNNGLFSTQIKSLIIRDSIVYAVANKKDILKSTDQGLTWTKLTTNLPDKQINCMSVSIKYLLVGNTNGFYISSDKGVNWLNKNNGILTSNSVNCILSDSTNNVYIGLPNGIYYANNAYMTGYNVTWVNKSDGLNNSTIKCLVRYGSKILAGSEGGGIFISDNNGSYWSASNNGLTNDTITCMVVSENNIFAGTKSGGVCMSTNEGVQWTAVNTGLTNLKIISLRVIGSSIYAGTDKGLFVAPIQDMNWISIPNEIFDANINCITNDKDNIFVGTNNSGLLISSDSGENWKRPNSGISLLKINCLAGSSNNMYVGTEGGGIFVSSNKGNNWKSFSNGLSSNYIHSIVISGDSIFAGTHGGLEFLTENDYAWKTIYNGQVSKNFVLGDDIYCCSSMYVLTAKRNELVWKQIMYNDVRSMAKIGQKTFAGMLTQYGPKGIITGGGLFVKNDNDTLWKEIGFKNKSVGTMVINKSNLLVLSDKGFLITTDLGISWEPIKFNAPDTYLTTIVGNGKDIFLGTSGLDDTPGMLFSSSDNGSSWKVIDTILNEKLLLNMNISGNYLFLNFTKDGMYRIDISDYVSVEEKPGAEEFSVYPNPAGDFITVTLKPSEGFEPSEGSEIEIYNTLGEKVMTVEQTFLSVQQINISDLPKGIYILRMGNEVAKFIKL